MRRKHPSKGVKYAPARQTLKQINSYIDKISLKARGLKMMSRRIKSNFPDAAVSLLSASRKLDRALRDLEEAELEVELHSDEY